MVQIFTPDMRGTVGASPYDKPSLFLGGSIEMGKAVHWQFEVEEHFRNQDIVIFNPRRPNWDASWTQSSENNEFVHQVEWELAKLQAADAIVMVFDKNTLSPISLLELGLSAGRNAETALNKMIVLCPNEFWRSGNVEIVCNRYSIPMVNSMDDLLEDVEALMRRNFERRMQVKAMLR
jgi:hypothetical protein